MGTHEISRGTVRRALDELEFEGRVRRQAGQGTFITESTPVMHKPCWTLVYRFRHGESADLQGIESVAEEMGAEVVVEYVADSRSRFAAAVDRMLAAKAKGVLIEPLPYEKNTAQVYQPILDSGMAIVLMHNPVPEVQAPLVACDNELIGKQITQHLLDMGHRRIGYVASPMYWVIEKQLAGYRAALEAGGVKRRDEWVSLESVTSPERGLDATAKLLKLKDPPTAIIALSDETAANAYRAIAAAGLRVPHDISVVAATGGGPHLSAALSPPLTVWCSGDTAFQMGRTAAHMLHGLIQKTWPTDANEVFVDPAPVPRGSVAMAPNPG